MAPEAGTFRCMYSIMPTKATYGIDNDVHERFQDTFPAFKSLKLEAVINSRSLYLHVRRVMNALENAVFSLYDAEVFIEYLRNLGERHKTWPVRLEHFDIIGEALIWTLKDSFPTKCTDYVAETWRELFRFITATMTRGLRRASTGKRELKLRDPVDWESVERKTGI
ncbi:neuroglobin-like [Pocillopora damicornis]|uniref:neuroglobin-like n=1 Tax=Pocillopora damicornis TaxID=46731 RepID=UPI000F550CFE|nr:neuroglobin-like [Pocillopora damicornis]